MNVHDKDKLLNYEEMAAYLRISTQALRQRVSKGTIPFLKMGKTVRFRKSTIDEWMVVAHDPKD